MESKLQCQSSTDCCVIKHVNVRGPALAGKVAPLCAIEAYWGVEV